MIELALAALLAAADTPAQAPAAMQPAFANTIVSTYPDGRKAELWLNADGTYTAEGRRHDRSRGVWTLKDADKICLRQKSPPTLPFSYCTSVPNGGVGATWSAKGVFGDPLKVELVAGRQDAGA